jgi:GT2 family glycosyltransferase
MMVRATDWHESGGFDERFFAHMEEIDLCWRLKRKGKKIMVCPTSVIYHLGGGTLPQLHPRKTFLNFRNSLLMLLKNLPCPQTLPDIYPADT